MLRADRVLRSMLLVAVSFSVMTGQEKPEPPTLQSQLNADIDDGNLDHFRPIEAAFILSGVSNRDSLAHYVAWFEGIVDQIRAYNFDTFDKAALAQKIFAILHSNILGEYALESTTLLDIVNRKEYNCVSSTILYNLVCQAMGIETKAFETPTHVYTIFIDFDEKFIVENTSPMGFNILKNLNAYSHFLHQYYPQDQRLSIGLDRLYAYENRNGRPINNSELLGLLAYNQAYFAAKQQDFERAYDFVLTAQRFNADSRSNINFEQNLYFRWGKKCYDEKRYFDAFTVFADGFYRYPDNGGLEQNTRLSFLNCLQYFWYKKDWPASKQLLDETFELLPLDDKGRDQTRVYLQRWLEHFRYQKDEHNLQMALEYIKTLEKR
ncbi:MAG: hypothetical protein H6696_03375 [Deferribacteres bacterium]|nr:hypothetical protein [Deferribacteres bacterium]